MKITMLGTAAIGYPLAFCNCDNCKAARFHKGKSIRKRASILINDDLIIDLGPDTQIAMSMYDKDMGKVRYLLQTHIHSDHYDEGLFATRVPGNVDKALNRLDIVIHPKCLKFMRNGILKQEQVDLYQKCDQEKLNIGIHNIVDGEEFELGNYKIKAIESMHDNKNGSLLYVIRSGDKSIFYATDTPRLTEQALKDLSDERFDLVIMDHTLGNVFHTSSHLNEQLFIEQIEKLRDLGIITDKTFIYGTHISHDGNPYHEEAEVRAISNGYHIAYDGMEIEL